MAVAFTTNPSPVPAGTDITYTVTVTNTSVEPVHITSLVDAPFGDLAGKGTCLPGGAPVSVAVGMSYACSFDAPVPGDANSTHQDTVTATAVDDEDWDALQ